MADRLHFAEKPPKSVDGSVDRAPTASYDAAMMGLDDLSPAAVLSALEDTTPTGATRFCGSMAFSPRSDTSCYTRAGAMTRRRSPA